MLKNIKLSAIFFCIALFSLLAACASPEPETAAASRDLSGMDSRYNQEAQKLYAKARVLWDRHENCSNPDLAIEYLDVAITIEPEFAAAYMRRALAETDLGYWDDAFDDSSKAIRLVPESDNYAYRGLMFMRQGNFLGARKDLEKSLRLDSKNVKAKTYMEELRKLEQK